MKEQIRTGILEHEGRGGGRLREVSLLIDKKPGDPFFPQSLIQKWKLRDGSHVEAAVSGGGRQGPRAERVLAVNGLPPEEWTAKAEFSSLTAVDPEERIRLTTGPDNVPMRIVDMVCPVGKGQRALIVAPPKTGKTILMQQFAHAISANHPEIDLIVLLVDERPEEVTDMRRTVRGEVFASSNDHDAPSHARLARLTLEHAKRRVEAGRDVVILLDSLTRLGRVFNSVQRGSGRTMSGGVDIRALEIPKRIFGAARALEGGGSLTIIATALIETNSRMDELIFQEFKGTGNMELVLSRELANERIFPAINVVESGTRREELLFKSETPKYHALRRALNRMKPKEAMLALMKAVADNPTNRRLVARMASEREMA